LTVLQVIPRLDAGGAERTTIDIAGAITAAGGKALVVSQGGRMEGELNAAAAELIRLPVASKNPITILQNAARLERIVREHGVSVIHARSRAPAWSAFLASRALKVPLVTTYHGAYQAGGRLKRFYNSVMTSGEIVIANSDFTAERISGAYDLPKSRISVIPRGTDFNVFDPEAVAPERIAALKAAWGLAGHEGPLILLPGRLTRWKGQLVLIEAMRLIKEQQGLLGAVAVLAGDPQGREDYRQEVESAIDASGLRSAVRIVGHVHDMPAAYAAASVVVSASTEPEAFGRVMVEAGAMCRPVIATDHGGARETVITEPPDIVTGWLIKPGDPAGLAETIIRALSLPPEEKAAMGARGRAYARRRFSREAMCRATLQVYLRVIDNQVSL
jgi:glycosyltransferase involved in cell wall biosynthesis